MQNKQNISQKVSLRLHLKNNLVWVSVGIGITVLLFAFFFIGYNLGITHPTKAAGSLGTVSSGYWHSNDTWNLNRVPQDREEIIVSANDEVIITRDTKLDDVIIKVYGTVRLINGKLRLNDRSTILIAKEGKLISQLGNNDQIKIGKYAWKGDEINAINSPSQLTSAGESSVDLLPVSLEYFNGETSENHSVIIKWATLSEKENDYFTVEHCTDGKNFIPIANIKGASKSITKIEYSFEDNNAVAGNNYYRLKQTDINGTIEYFKIINVIQSVEGKRESAKALSSVSVSPNPFSDKLSITYNASQLSQIELSIASLEGNTVHKEMLSPELGKNTFNFAQANDLRSGIYIVQLKSNGQIIRQKIIKSYLLHE